MINLEWEVVSVPVDDEAYDFDLPAPCDPAWMAREIAVRLDGEDMPDCGLFMLAHSHSGTIDVQVMTEDANGREFFVAGYKVTVTPITHGGIA